MKKLLVAVLTLFTSLAQADGQVSNDFQNWMSINTNVQINDKYRAFLELNPRLMDNGSRLGAAYIRPAIGYDINPNLTVWAGYVLQATNSQANLNYVLENQSYQQVTWRGKVGDDNWEFRNAVEERYLPSEMGYRSRSRIRYEYVIPNQKTWSLIGSDEVFMNFNNVQASSVRSGIAQNRAYVGVGYRFTPSIQVESGYMNQHVWNGGDLVDQNNHVWQSNLNLNF
jgi:ribosomal protein L32E